MILMRPDKGGVAVDERKKTRASSAWTPAPDGAPSSAVPRSSCPKGKRPRFAMHPELHPVRFLATRCFASYSTPSRDPPGCSVRRDPRQRSPTFARHSDSRWPLKYIMPEAIVINRILLCDEKTCCMKPYLQVNLLVDAVVGSVMQKGGNRYLTLRKIFRQRLVKFFRNHPEGDDIPEHELPHPFTQRSAQITQRVLREAKSVMPSPCLADQQPIGMSHFPPSFKKFFSKRSSTSSSTDSITSPVVNAESTASSPQSHILICATLLFQRR